MAVPNWPLHSIDFTCTNIDKLCGKVGQKFICLCNLIGCEAQEGAEKTINWGKRLKLHLMVLMSYSYGK